MTENWFSRLSHASSTILSQIATVFGRAPLEAINAAVNKKNFELHRNLAYGTLERQKLDLYLAPHALGTIMFVHGGYWDSGSKDDYIFLAESLCTHGFHVAAVNYRLAPEGVFPNNVDDVALALRWLRYELPNYGVSSSFIGALGHSAGAHLLALLCVCKTHLERVGLTRDALGAAVCIAGPYDFLKWLETDPRAQKAMGARQQWLETQPVLVADGKNPPMLLLHGARDTLCSPAHAPRLAHEIRQRGGEVTWAAYETLDHFSIVGAFSKLTRWLEPKVLDDTVAFFKSKITSQ
ncbi:MAG: alpha/beta hydrolase [Deinococcales bacterium]